MDYFASSDTFLTFLESRYKRVAITDWMQHDLPAVERLLMSMYTMRREDGENYQVSMRSEALLQTYITTRDAFSQSRKHLISLLEHDIEASGIEPTDIWAIRTEIESYSEKLAQLTHLLLEIMPEDAIETREFPHPDLFLEMIFEENSLLEK
jgi:hypothetical protein